MNAANLLNQAAIAFNESRYADSLQIAQKLLTKNPRDAEALHLLANIYFELKELPEAEKTILAAIALNKKNGHYYYTYGIILKTSRRVDEALAMNYKALELNPPGLLPNIYTNIGGCLHEKRDMPGALAAFEKAMQIDPNYALAYFSRGIAYYEMGGDLKLVESDFNKASALDPTNLNAMQNMSVIFHQLNDYINAIRVLRHALEISPNYENGWILLAHSYYKVGKTETAQTLLKQLVQQYPDNAMIKLELAYMLPAISMSNADIDEWRAHFMRETELLTKQDVTVPEWRVLNLPFYQAYHGRKNKEFMVQMARLFMHICPAIHFTAPHCLKPPVRKKKIRVGYVSEFFHSGFLNQFYGEIIASIARMEDIEIILFAQSARVGESVDKLTQVASKYLMLPTHLVPAQKMIADEEIDILIYLSIGLNTAVYMLAFARLAPVQCVMPGHPITTGIPNIDVYFSSQTTEPENAQEFYTEKLIAFKKNPAIFHRRHVPQERLTREELGLPTGDLHLYTSPVHLFKIHPDMDNIFKGILTRDPKARIILFDAPYAVLWSPQLKKRFAATMGPDLAARIIFVPFAQGDKFFHSLRAMDCILDTVHFSFGTTAFLLLGADIPFVTLPGSELRGRGAYGLYHEMGMTDLIASDEEDYITLAVRLATDKGYAREISEKISATSDLVFDDYAIIEEYADCLRKLHADACKG